MNKNTRLFVVIILSMCSISFLITFVEMCRGVGFGFFEGWYLLAVVGMGVLAYLNYKIYKQEK